MYIVTVITKNIDFLDSLPQAILNYDLRDLKFYFFTQTEQLDQLIMQSTLPDLILVDREIRLCQGVIDKKINTVYLSTEGDSESDILIYKNTESFLLDIHRRISISQIGRCTNEAHSEVFRERKLTWFLELNESEWGKSCFNDWTVLKYKNGAKTLSIDLSRMGRGTENHHFGDCFSISDLLQNWIYKGERQLETAKANTSWGTFTFLEGVKHPMDIEMITTKFIEMLMGQQGKAFEDIGLYGPIYNEAIAKTLLRFTENIWILSDQSDSYELSLQQIESWLKEINPRGEVNLMHSRSDPARQAMLKKAILDRCHMKGRI